VLGPENRSTSGRERREPLRGIEPRGVACESRAEAWWTDRATGDPQLNSEVERCVES